ncbi:MAG: hypothetical protein K6T63_15395 [Alicyclobacillus herbarius]|uniref:hypothetical protein n=1 Tax=Alicyclobacillus herbarius TaxID=122960 RepID=UPI0023534E98|nr:hypothetical protein [Alicyclobacillus herbarius]MCL6634001.1 hypothetical protein [Alicyclobacillus herbarius]
MSASTKAEQLLQRMNRRTNNTPSTIDDSIDQKKDILDTIAGPTTAFESQQESPSYDNNSKEQAIETSFDDNIDEQETIHSDKSKYQAQSSLSSERGNPKIEVERTSQTSVSEGLSSIAEQVVKEIKSKKTKRDTHKKATYELPIDLLERFDRIAKRMKEPRGFKEKTIQRLLEQFCDAVEAQLEQKKKN